MPGAPNRPPEVGEATPPVPPVPETPNERALRRLAPSRIALRLEIWKGAPPTELLAPFEKAEAAFVAGDFATATTALDLLSVRFAEPRWPTLPEPFRRLRVAIPAPMPPTWDPEHSLSAAERDARRARRLADDQVELAGASVDWAVRQHLAADDLGTLVAEARAALAATGVSSDVYGRLDAVWTAIRERVPVPKAAAPTRSSAAPAAPTEPSDPESP